MFVNRRQDHSRLPKRRKYCDSLLNDRSAATSSDALLGTNDDAQDPLASSKCPKKRRRCCGIDFHTFNTSRFAGHIHSRILQRFPFLIEMFYWIITYLFYRMTKVISQRIFTEEIWQIAEDHGLQILEFEEFGPLKSAFLWREHHVQGTFMGAHQTTLTILNRVYALIHIPGTVG